MERKLNEGNICWFSLFFMKVEQILFGSWTDSQTKQVNKDMARLRKCEGVFYYFQTFFYLK